MPLGEMENEPATGGSLRLLHGSAEAIGCWQRQQGPLNDQWGGIRLVADYLRRLFKIKG